MDLSTCRLLPRAISLDLPADISPFSAGDSDGDRWGLDSCTRIVCNRTGHLKDTLGIVRMAGCSLRRYRVCLTVSVEVPTELGDRPIGIMRHTGEIDG